KLILMKELHIAYSAGRDLQISTFSGADLQIGIWGSEDPRPGALRSEDRTQRYCSLARDRWKTCPDRSVILPVHGFHPHHLALQHLFQHGLNPILKGEGGRRAPAAGALQDNLYDLFFGIIGIKDNISAVA